MRRRWPSVLPSQALQLWGAGSPQQLPLSSCFSQQGQLGQQNMVFLEYLIAFPTGKLGGCFLLTPGCFWGVFQEHISFPLSVPGSIPSWTKLWRSPALKKKKKKKRLTSSRRVLPVHSQVLGCSVPARELGRLQNKHLPSLPNPKGHYQCTHFTEGQ